ncbi:MAG: aspartate--ammonia ligase [Gemmatimonadota bacterium]
MSTQRTFSIDSYHPLVSPGETEGAVYAIKDFFRRELAEALNLTPVCAPVFLEAGTGINDDLNSVERPVRFEAPSLKGRVLEVPQSLAKWKRMRLAAMVKEPGEGILAELTAIRPDEIPGPLHSLYVDQWEWERVITPEERTLHFLREIVGRIFRVFRKAEEFVASRFPQIEPLLPEEVTFLHSEELEAGFPDLTRQAREAEAARKHGAIFLSGIGAPLSDGQPHDGRAPDYDDWITQTGKGRGLNGDLIVWHPLLRQEYELSSMGIRVDTESLLQQLELRGCPEWRHRDFHRRLLAGELPLSIGGGIGQSRSCAYLLRKAHLGEVQSSVWPKETLAECQAQGIPLL